MVAPIGPYAPATQAGGFVFTSGQIALDPETGALVEGDIRVQTRQVMTNLSDLLRDHGVTLNDLVKTTVFLTNMDDFAVFNEVYASFFGDGRRPARSTVQVSRLPRGAIVEVEGVAYHDAKAERP